MMSKVFLETISTYVVSFAIGIMIGIAIYELSHKKKEPTGGTGYDEISKAGSQSGRVRASEGLARRIDRCADFVLRQERHRFGLDGVEEGAAERRAHSGFDASGRRELQADLCGRTRADHGGGTVDENARARKLCGESKSVHRPLILFGREGREPCDDSSGLAARRGLFGRTEGFSGRTRHEEKLRGEVDPGLFERRGEGFKRSEHGKNPAGASKFGARRENHFHFAAAFRRGKNFRDGGAGKAAVKKPVETDDARGERGGLSGARFSR